MRIFILITRIVLAAFMVMGGIGHFNNPAFYNPFIPDFLPTALINYGSGGLEILLGLGLFIPNYRQWAGLGIFVLMVIFLPIHIRDVFVANPAIGSKSAAYIRLPLQFVLIIWAWWVWKKAKE